MITKKMVLCLDCGTGTDACEFYEVPEDTLQDVLDNFAWENALSHAEMYGIYPESDREGIEEDEDDDSWPSDTYSEDINGWWEEYNPEKHDGKVCGSGSIVWQEF